jgi:SAM-dependent methyltransferase
VVGLGLNQVELDRNKALTERVLHDLNKVPTLPFPDHSFDVVLNTVSIDYLTQPFEVVAEVGRVLKPGGLFLLIFSNRMFPTKAVRIWREASEEERVLLVEEIVRYSGFFDRPQVFVAKGRPRPPDDVYTGLEPYSDPIYAVYADKKVLPDAARERPSRPSVELRDVEEVTPSELEERLRALKRTLQCPYCEGQLTKLFIDDHPFLEWETELLYACLNEFCPYVIRGYTESYRSGTRGTSYCFMYDPFLNRCSGMPVPSFRALKAQLSAHRTESLTSDD